MEPLAFVIIPKKAAFNTVIQEITLFVKLKHELWEEYGGKEYTFCLSGPRGDDVRKLLSPDAKLIWTVEAESHFEAMSAYYEFMGWGEYITDYDWDKLPYPEEWSTG